MPSSQIAKASFPRMLKIGGILAVALLAIAAKPAPQRSQSVVKDRYLSPLEVLSSPDGHQLYVLCEQSDELRVVDADSGRVTASIAVGRAPRGLTASPDGRQLY